MRPLRVGPSVVRAADTHASSVGDAAQTGAQILLVLPDLTLASPLACCLDDLGHSVKVAPTGRAAERLLDRWRFDAVVIDLDTEGFSTLRMMRRLASPGGPAIVLLRGQTEPAEWVRWLKAGASDFVPSPVTLDEVVARVEGVLRRRSPVDDAQWTLEIGALRMSVPFG